MGSTLERHPFSGLIHSAGELFSRVGTLAGPGTTISTPGARGPRGQLRLVCGWGIPHCRWHPDEGRVQAS